MAGGMTHAVERLASKHKALSSNPSTAPSPLPLFPPKKEIYFPNQIVAGTQTTRFKITVPSEAAQGQMASELSLPHSY
jgi:hypothetical protein